MRWIRSVLIVSTFIFILLFSSNVVYGYVNLPYQPGGYTEAQINLQCGGVCPPPALGTNTTQGPYGGYYLSTNGNYYPIGIPATGGGSGPSDSGSGVCTGVYDSCGSYTTCSAACGPGTQTQRCYDSGCGVPQDTSVSCMINDPNVWTVNGTCSVNCGTGTESIINQCGTTSSQACNTSACPAWTKLKDSSFVSRNSLTDMLALAPVAYDSDDTTQQYFIVGTDGIVVASAISLDISNTSPTTKPSGRSFVFAISRVGIFISQQHPKSFSTLLSLPSAMKPDE